VRISFTLNGRPAAVEAEPDARALDVLREELGLVGVKEGCGSGECGACTVLVDGVAKLSCLLLAAQLAGRELVTIEGLGSGESPGPLQRAFVERGAVQCGFCTPGMILAAEGLLRADPRPGPEQIRQGLSGNLCRCTGYQKIVEAVASAAREREGS
jgi:carbon-monoxide dehydrogenase small subunit